MLDDVVKDAVEGLVRGILSRKGDKSSDHLEVQSLVLRDSQGRGREVLSMLENGPGLTLLDEQEQLKAMLALDKLEAYLKFCGKNNATCIELRIDNNEPELVFFDAAQTPRASLMLHSDGPSLRLWDKAGKCRVQIEMDEESEPTVTVFDENEIPCSQLDCGA